VTLTFFIIIGLVFGLVAATMAFLTTYGEYSRHHYMAKSLTLKMSLEIASVIFAVFIIIAVVIAFVMSK
jgi:hypothetical protein